MDNDPGLPMQWNQVANWLRKDRKAVQNAATIVQAVTAVIMLLTLWHSCSTLSITRKQLEATVEPVVTIEYPEQTLDSVLFRNQGAVSVSDLRIFKIVHLLFDSSSGKIKTHLFTPVPQWFVTCQMLHSGRSFFMTNLFEFKPVKDIFPTPAEGEIRAACFVVRYARSVDMSPRFKLLMFITHDGVRGADPFPVDITSSYAGYGSGDKPHLWLLRASVIEFLRGLDIPISINN